MNRIDYIENYGFRIRGRYIEKRSQSTRHFKVVGQLNDNNFFFFSDNVYPFKQGLNSFKNKSIVDDEKYIKHIERVKQNNRNDFNVEFDKYIETTKKSSIFGTFLNKTTREFLNKNAYNYFDIRGITKGYMEHAVLFPFFDYDNNFVTAQIIKYQSNGKRLKKGFNTNWFHTYKPIKSSLGLNQNDKYSISVKSFFGENYLNGSRNVVAIVEAPKTAVILKEIYPNIDWIATAGEQQIFNKDLSVLNNKDVVIFADAHSTKWKDFAKEHKFLYCDILDIEDVKAGSDIADFILDAESIVFNELHNFIFSLNDRSFDFETNEDDLELDFKVVGNEQSYLAVVPFKYKEFDIVHKIDNADNDNIIFNGKNFDIYKSDYWILNANVDFHKQQRTEDNKPVGFNDTELVWHLQKCYRVLKHLNKDLPIKPVFKQVLKALLKHSNFSFNSYYVLNRLVPIWDKIDVDLTSFIKHRNWKYKSSKSILRSDFQKELNNDRFRCKLNMRLLAFKDALVEDRFIDIETDLGLKSYDKQRGYSQIFDLVNEWNEKVIGAKTLKSYLRILEIKEKTKSLHPYIENTYIGAKKMFFGFSLKELAQKLDYSNTQSLKKIITFKRCNDTKTLIKKKVDEFIENINNITPVRLKIKEVSKITDFIHKESLSQLEQLKNHLQQWEDVFKSKERLIIELEHIKENDIKNIYLNEIKYLMHLKELQIEKSEDKIPTLSDFKIDDILKRTYKNIDVSHIKVVDF